MLYTHTHKTEKYIARDRINQIGNANIFVVPTQRHANAFSTGAGGALHGRISAAEYTYIFFFLCRPSRAANRRVRVWERICETCLGASEVRIYIYVFLWHARAARCTFLVSECRTRMRKTPSSYVGFVHYGILPMYYSIPEWCVSVVCVHLVFFWVPVSGDSIHCKSATHANAPYVHSFEDDRLVYILFSSVSATGTGAWVCVFFVTSACARVRSDLRAPISRELIFCARVYETQMSVRYKYEYEVLCVRARKRSITLKHARTFRTWTVLRATWRQNHQLSSHQKRKNIHAAHPACSPSRNVTSFMERDNLWLFT